MIEFTDNGGIFNVIPISQIRRLSFGETLATLTVVGRPHDVQIAVALYVADAIQQKLTQQSGRL